MIKLTLIKEDSRWRLAGGEQFALFFDLRGQPRFIAWEYLARAFINLVE